MLDDVSTLMPVKLAEIAVLVCPVVPSIVGKIGLKPGAPLGVARAAERYGVVFVKTADVACALD